jgi:acyl-CoA thioesterase I
VFGDSISAAYGLAASQGWVALLQKRLAQSGADPADYGYRVVNASVSGETTAGGRARLERALEVHRPAILLLELGGNDGLRGLPVDKARENLDAMVVAAQRKGAKVLLLGMRMPTNYGPVYTRQFDAMYREIARRRRVPLVPFLLEGVAMNPALMQADGIHPNARAQPKLLDLVWPELEPLLDRK